MAVGRPKKHEIEARRRKVSGLYLRGLTQHEIAAQMGVNQATISRDIKALEGDWHESRLRTIDEHKERILAEIDEVKRQAWAKGQTRVVLMALKQESDIVGVNAPTKTEHAGKVEHTHVKMVEVVKTYPAQTPMIVEAEEVTQ